MKIMYRVEVKNALFEKMNLSTGDVDTFDDAEKIAARIREHLHDVGYCKISKIEPSNGIYPSMGEMRESIGVQIWIRIDEACAYPYSEIVKDYGYYAPCAKGFTQAHKDEIMKFGNQ